MSGLFTDSPDENMLDRIGLVGGCETTAELARKLGLAGIHVLLVNPSKEILESTVQAIRQDVESQIQNKTITPATRDSVMGRIQLSLDLHPLKEINFVVDLSHTDNTSLKEEMMSDLGKLCPVKGILATYSPFGSVTKLAMASARPEQVVGLQFVPPLVESRFVEIVRGVKSSDHTVEMAKNLAAKIGLEQIVTHDFPGFVVLRSLASSINEAIYTLYEGISAAPEIDKALRMTWGANLGPLAIADRIGLDFVLKTLKSLHAETGQTKYAPCPLLVKYVEAGYLGRKSKKGFYEYKLN